MLSRNEFMHKPDIWIDTTKSEVMIHEKYINDMDIPMDYLINKMTPNYWLTE